MAGGDSICCSGAAFWTRLEELPENSLAHQAFMASKAMAAEDVAMREAATAAAANRRWWLQRRRRHVGQQKCRRCSASWISCAPTGRCEMGLPSLLLANAQKKWLEALAASPSRQLKHYLSTCPTPLTVDTYGLHPHLKLLKRVDRTAITRLRLGV